MRAQIKDQPRKTFKPKEEKPSKRNVNVFHRPDVILRMLGLMRSTDCDWETFDVKECERDIFACTTPTVVHDLFYKLLKLNKLFNKNVRTDHSLITQFDIGDITIQETTDYKEVASTIERLNLTIASETEQHVYHGQSIHRLAYEYYERKHNKN